MALTNCTSAHPSEELSCARNLDARAIKTVLEGANIRTEGGPPDNITTLAHPDLAWANGSVIRVPLMIASTADEGSSFVLSALEQLGSAVNTTDSSNFPDTDASAFLATALSIPETLASQVLTLYSPSSGLYNGPNNTIAIISQIITDFTFSCTSRFFANLTSTHLGQPTWRYVFDAVTPSIVHAGYEMLGAYHGSELGLVF